MYERIIATVLAHPWAILDAKFDAIVSVLAMRAGGERFTEAEIRERVGERRESPAPYLLALPGPEVDGLPAGSRITKMSVAVAGEDFAAAADRLMAKSAAVADGSRKLIAVIPVHGIIMPRAADFEMSTSGISIEKLRAQFRQALATPDVSAIVLDFDSPGGSVYHVDEMASEIFDARGQKKIVAQIDPLSASAAYYLASQASDVVMTPSGEVGSIGVRAMHQDISRALEMKGIRITHISAGKYKTEGNPYEALSADARDHLQSLVDTYNAAFVKAVARGRETTAARVEKDFGQGRIYGAAEAKQRGMIDRVATLDETLARLGAGAGGARAATLAAGAQVPALAAADMSSISAEAGAEIPQRFPAGFVAGPFLPSTVDRRPSTDFPIPATAEKQSEVLVMDPVTQTAAAAVNPAIVAEAARVEALQSLAAMHPTKCGKSQLEAWINDGTPVADANQVIMSRYASAARPLPGPSSETLDALGGARDVTPGRGPFRSFGEQMVAIAAAATPGGKVDPRLFKVHEIQAVATGGSVSVPSDAGFLVQTDFSMEIMRRTYETGALASRCSRTGIGDNSDSLEVPYVDETTRANGSRWGGVRVARAAETDDVAAGKVKIGKWECRLEDLKGRAWVTNRQLRDASSLTSVLNEAMSEEFAFVLDDEIYSGDGAAKCLGILKSAALVTVAKEVGQAAGTVVAENITNMWSRCWSRSRLNAAWFYNQELDAQFPLMNVGIGTGGALIFMPPGGLSGLPYATLYGRPLIPIEQAYAAGTVGDLLLADCTEYKLIDKDGMQQASSIHVHFVNDETCFKFLMRVNGQPKWKTALTPYRATAGKTLSPFVALAIRA